MEHLVDGGASSSVDLFQSEWKVLGEANQIEFLAIVRRSFMHAVGCLNNITLANILIYNDDGGIDSLVPRHHLFGGDSFVNADVVDEDEVAIALTIMKGRETRLVSSQRVDH